MSELPARIPVRPINMENKVGIRVKIPHHQPGVIERRRPLGDVGNKQKSDTVALKKPEAAALKITIVSSKRPVTVINKKKANVTERVAKKEVVKNTLSVPETDTFTKELKEFEKIDLCTDPQLVSVYIHDIYGYLQDLEKKYVIKRDFLNGHESTPKLRQILVDWLADVHQSFKMVLETLHITVAILDRYLEVHKDVGKETLQLVGATALFVAAKYEEIYPPEIADIVFMCDNAFSKQEVLEMERDILKTLKFQFGRPLSIQFLRRFNRVCRVNQEHHSMGKYLLELALVNYELCHIPPSLQAAAACCLAKEIIGGVSCSGQGWTKALIHFSHYKYEDIKGVLVKMACAIGKAEISKQQVIRQKYSSSKYDKISLHSNLRGPLVRKLVAQSPVLSMK